VEGSGKGDAAGQPEGVVGGDPGAGEGTPALLPIPARPADLASVRARLARTLHYPAEARRRQIQGRAVVEFILRADGRVEALGLRQSAGDEALDRAALAAVMEGAPYPPPGVDVLVVVPLSFRLGA